MKLKIGNSVSNMRRELGTGHWDVKLINNMVSLSEADNYDDAKHEWLATGDVWWNGNGDMPDWVRNSENQAGSCLCGHRIVYHFRILNTINGNEEVVGSDHINSYMIMRQIADEHEMEIGTVTDEQVAEWLKVRVGSMKAESWWATNGTNFELMFSKIRELDLWLNVHIRESYWSSVYNWTESRRVLRKASKGTFGHSNYKMASIVWRWNHPDNPKNQFTTRGYPNQKLMQDLAWLYVTCDSELERYNSWKAGREARKEMIELQRREAQERRDEARRRREEAEAERLRIYNLPENVEKRRIAAEESRIAQQKQRQLRIERQQEKERLRNEAVRNTIEDLVVDDNYINNCNFLGIPVLTKRTLEFNEYSLAFDFIRNASSGRRMNLQNYLHRLQDIFNRPPTEAQKEKLKSLNLKATTRLEAEQLIQEEERLQ